MKNPFPEFIKKLPVKDYGLEGLIVHADGSALGETYFVYAEKEIPFPEHAHGAQWTVVLSGKCDFTSGGKTTTYSKGDTYLINEGQKHQITLYPGYAEMDYVLNPGADTQHLQGNKGKGMRLIDDDLQKGFDPESKAVFYLAFADQADADGMDNIARLYRAVAESEKVHALIHFKFMNKIGDTKDNLKFTVEAEKRGYTELYPDFIKDAEATGEKEMAKYFRAIDKVEDCHANLFERALNDPFSIKEDTEYYVCSVCGYVSEGPCDKCPACGMGADKFNKVE